MAVTTPVDRKRCSLCLMVLEVATVALDGSVVRMEFDHHTALRCAAMTESRIRALEEIHMRDARQIEAQDRSIADLGEWIGVAAGILASGRRWIAHRQKRAEDIARLRSALATGDRVAQNPLWAAEEEVVEAIRTAIAAVELRSRT